MAEPAPHRSAAGASPSDASLARPKPARRSPAAIIAFVLIAAGGTALDLWTKHAAFDSLLNDPDASARIRRISHAMGPDAKPSMVLHRAHLQQRLMPGVQLTLSTNPGVVFGLKPHKSPTTRKLIVVGATVLCLALVGVFFATSPAGAWWSHVALAFILAGALGNLYDRMFAAVRLPGVQEPIRGQVRDFIDCSELHYQYIFNIADVLLVVGVGVLIVQWLIQGRKDDAARAAAKKAG